VLDDETAPGVLRLADAAARTDTARSDGSLMVPPRVTLLLPPYLNDEGIHALRVLAALHQRHASLRVRLVADGEERGVAPLLQDARLHAAALGMAAALSVQSLDAWLAEGSRAGASRVEASRNEDVLWVVDAGDAGTLAVVEAMHRAIPVVASAARHYADLVLPGVTGLHLPQAKSAPSALDDGAQLLSDLARVLGDAEWRSTMGAAGQRHLHRVRAPRAILHGLRVMLDPTSSPLA
jgi:glycosyltransferase involved in cell wall biosynthesis